jgi:hypothetical protein
MVQGKWHFIAVQLNVKYKKTLFTQLLKTRCSSTYFNTSIGQQNAYTKYSPSIHNTT